MPSGPSSRKQTPQENDSKRLSLNSLKRAAFPKKSAGANSENPTLAPVIDLKRVSPKLKKVSAKPTGLAAPSPITRATVPAKSRSIGPKAITRPVNPIQIASRLNAEQQLARHEGAAGEDLTREELLSEAGTNGSGTVLPGQFSPLKGMSAYGQAAKAPPGSLAEAPELDIERGGGIVQSDLERQRAMQLEQQKMIGAAGLIGAKAVHDIIEPSPRAKAAEPTSAEIPEPDAEAPATQRLPQAPRTEAGKSAEQLQAAQNIAAQAGFERTAKALAAADSIRGNLEALRKAQKTAQATWNLIKTGELAAGMSIVSLLVLIITANLQMINKYTFKMPLVPPTFFVEDAIIVCIDCALCANSCLSVFLFPLFLIPLIGALIIIGIYLGLDLTGFGGIFGNLF